MIKDASVSVVESVIWVERRSGKDRRQKRFSIFRRPFNGGRRRSLRRQADRRRIYLLDYYSPGLLNVVMLVLMLSVLDAILTLWLLELGAQELNPIMAYFLKFGPNVFIAAKYLLTSISVVIIVLLNYICIFRIQYQLGNLLKYFAGCFAAVVVWELFLIARFVL